MLGNGVGYDSTDDDREVRGLIAKQHVLNVYPAAKCIPHSIWAERGRGYGVFKMIWIPLEDSLDTKTFKPHVMTEWEAWEYAWEAIQKEMLAKLEA